MTNADLWLTLVCLAILMLLGLLVVPADDALMGPKNFPRPATGCLLSEGGVQWNCSSVYPYPHTGSMSLDRCGECESVR